MRHNKKNIKKGTEHNVQEKGEKRKKKRNLRATWTYTHTHASQDTIRSCYSTQREKNDQQRLKKKKR